MATESLQPMSQEACTRVSASVFVREDQQVPLRLGLGPMDLRFFGLALAHEPANGAALRVCARTQRRRPLSEESATAVWGLGEGTGWDGALGPQLP